MEDTDVDLKLAGKTVARCCFDAAFSIEFLEKDFRTAIRIGGRMTIRLSGSRLELSAEKPTEAAQASVLWGKTVTKATGLKDGSLDITFSDGSTLIVPVDPDYEAWEFRGNKGFLVVSRPGGGLAVWDPV